eukprot:SAG31_NODE_2004_length_6685_cov_2.189341_4_plen_86_part_00
MPRHEPGSKSIVDFTQAAMPLMASITPGTARAWSGHFVDETARTMQLICVAALIWWGVWFNQSSMNLCNEVFLNSEMNSSSTEFF